MPTFASMIHRRRRLEIDIGLLARLLRWGGVLDYALIFAMGKAMLLAHMLVKSPSVVLDPGGTVQSGAVLMIKAGFGAVGLGLLVCSRFQKLGPRLTTLLSGLQRGATTRLCVPLCPAFAWGLGGRAGP